MEPTSNANGIDLDPARRPGVPRERPPAPWPNTRYPPARQEGAPAAPKHGRPGKRMPPVYGTAVPPHGVSGAIRRAAYHYPDHLVRHWMLLLLADRVDSMGTHAFRLLKVVAPVALLALGGARVLGLSRR